MLRFEKRNSVNMINSNQQQLCVSLEKNKDFPKKKLQPCKHYTIVTNIRIRKKVVDLKKYGE